jgi:hypothetical protein
VVGLLIAVSPCLRVAVWCWVVFVLYIWWQDWWKGCKVSSEPEIVGARRDCDDSACVEPVTAGGVADDDEGRVRLSWVSQRDDPEGGEVSGAGAYIVRVAVPVPEVSEAMVSPSCRVDGGLGLTEGNAEVVSASLGSFDLDHDGDPWVSVLMDADEDAAGLVRMGG